MKINELKKKNITGLNRLILSLTCTVFMFFFTAISGNSATLPDTTISHSGNPSLAMDHSLPVQVRVTDSLPIVSVRCYFRFQDTSQYVYVDLSAGENDMFLGTLPPPVQEEMSIIEYFFLVVNDRHQVVRSRSFVQELINGGEVSGKTLADDPYYVVKTELPGLPTGEDFSLFNPDQITFEKTTATEQYGLIGGVYEAADFAGTATREGYYGGFVISESGELVPVKGIIYGLPEQNLTEGRSLQMADPLLFQDTTEETTSDIIGPDIQGDDWTGVAFLQDGHGNTYFETPVTAVVTHMNDQVTITLTFRDYLLLPISEYFWGSMTEVGDMTLYDELVPPETWTTHFGPATETSITIADYTDIYDPEENPYPDLYVVELSRDPEPPPPPEPDVPSYLPAIYKLLLF